ncbi:30S ribosomal protein S7 [Candidatus Micrarchaeota archaeon]|nr:30S ribosomal protein S7 [Candidatus Micrarchaeota archaeon]
MEKLFNKYDVDNVVIEDLSLADYISINPTIHSHGRHAKKQFYKTKINVVERLVNKLMRGGTGKKVGGKIIRTHGGLQGKKTKMLKVVEDAFDIINKRTGKNPIQLLVQAIANAAPREDFTRVSMGGVSYQMAVDISAQRRVDVAIRNIAMASLISSFNKRKKLSVSLAEEIISTAEGNTQKSYAIKKRDEIERMARAAR